MVYFTQNLQNTYEKQRKLDARSSNVHQVETYTNACTFLPLPLVYVSTHLQRFSAFSFAFRTVFLRNITNNSKNEGLPRVGTYTE